MFLLLVWWVVVVVVELVVVLFVCVFWFGQEGSSDGPKGWEGSPGDAKKTRHPTAIPHLLCFIV